MQNLKQEYAMPARSIIKTRIKVFLWGKEIGTLTWVPAQGNSYFNFSDEYFRMGVDLCPITHPLNDPSTRLAILGESEKNGDQTKAIYQGLPPFLADSLPDRWGNAIFEKWFAENKVENANKTPVMKLSFIGKRAMGAFEFVPELKSGKTRGEVLLPLLYQQAVALEKELSEREVKDGPDLTLDALKALGTSAGGRQKKVIVSRTPEGKYVSGETSTDRENRHFILKFNTPEYCLSEIEMAFFEMCRDADIKMMDSEPITVEGIKHFLTERFDRRDGKKVVTQTLAAINPEANSYEDLFQTCRRLSLPEPEITELFRRTVFNFLSNNTDDHKKNFSFLMDEDGLWHLAPAYDMTFIIATDGNRPESSHCMSLAGKRDGITIRELVGFGKRMGIKSPERIIGKIKDTLSNFDTYAARNSINAYYTQMIRKRIGELCGTATEEIGKAFKKDGWDVQDVKFERTLQGNIHMHAKVFGNEEKLVITPKKPLYQEIMDKGFNDMSIKNLEDIFMKRKHPINCIL